MWFTKQRTPAPAADRAVEAEPDQPTCRSVLVVHADGTLECDQHPTCGAEELLHEWSIGCDELRCGCLGEEHDGWLELAAAA